MGMGRFHALPPTFLGNILDIPFQQAKAVADNCSNVAASPLPIPLCALCASARVLPIRRASRRGAVSFSSWLGAEGQCSHPCLLGGIIRFAVSNQPSLFQESSHLRKQTFPFPPLRLCASARVLPIRSRSAFSYAPMTFSDILQLNVRPSLPRVAPPLHHSKGPLASSTPIPHASHPRPR